MKIQLPNHNIKAVEKVDTSDIPIAYIDTSEATYGINFSISKDFSCNSKKQVYAYDKFTTDDYILFDSSGAPIENVNYKRSGNTYYYQPANITEFTPTTFTCSALVQKQMTYDSSAKYNMRIGVVELDESFSFSSSLIPIFGDAYKRGICPTNITVNNGDKTYQSLLGAGDETADFIFLQSDDGIDLQGLEIDSAMDKHINLWLSVKNFDNMLIESNKDTGGGSTMEGQLSDCFSQTERVKLSNYMFNRTSTHPSYPTSTYTYSFPYEDVLILQRKNKGFIVVTPEDFLSNVTDNAKIIYDVLIYIFLNSYKTSKIVESWITNEPVDYAAYSYLPLNQYHKNINLKDMLASEDYDIGNEYQLISVNTSKTEVSFVSMNSNKDLYFRKNKTGTVDPVKGNNSISYVTTNNTVVIYNSEDVYKIKSRASLSSTSSSQGLFVTIGELRDSEKRIYIDKKYSLQITDVSKNWYICVKPYSSSQTCEPVLIDKNSYSQDLHGYCIAEATITTGQQPKIIDMRVSGGGLPVSDEDNYNCIDIGNIYGRPYRLGSTLIIKLPKRLETYRTIIEAAVKQHIAAGEYPILLFEKEIE